MARGFRSEAHRKAVMASIGRAKMGVGSRRDIRKAHRHGKKVLKARRKKGERFLRNTVGKSRSEVRAYRKRKKGENKEHLEQRLHAMKRRHKLLKAYRTYRSTKSKVNKKYPKNDIRWS